MIARANAYLLPPAPAPATSLTRIQDHTCPVSQVATVVHIVTEIMPEVRGFFSNINLLLY